MADHFGDGPIPATVDATCISCVIDARPPAAGSHGYHVVGTAAGSFANNGTPAGRVTGLLPARTQLKLIDVGNISSAAVGLRIIQAVKATPGNVVVNTSLGSRPQLTDSQSVALGTAWIEDVRRAGIHDRFVHAASAGNAGGPAQLNERWNAASIRADVGTAANPALANTLAVENLTTSGAPDFTPGCRAASSNFFGHVSAVGENVFSTVKRKRGGTTPEPSGAGKLSGTSMASPQVAALAEYVWTLAPTLTAPQVATLIRVTARPVTCTSVTPPAPVVDAYAAVLATDAPAPVSPAASPVRLAVLDLDGDGDFDERDLSDHALAIDAASNRRDWGRSDLNGDGSTGRGTRATFDLDPTRPSVTDPPNLTTVTRTIAGVEIDFDEHAVSDLDVLCFSAFSNLYTGSASARDAMVNGVLHRCGATLRVTPQTASVAPNGTVTFTALLNDTPFTGVTWSATGGTISPSGVFTAPATAGTQTVTATDANDPATTASATVTVTSQPGRVEIVSFDGYSRSGAKAAGSSTFTNDNQTGLFSATLSSNSAAGGATAQGTHTGALLNSAASVRFTSSGGYSLDVSGGGGLPGQTAAAFGGGGHATFRVLDAPVGWGMTGRNCSVDLGGASGFLDPGEYTVEWGCGEAISDATGFPPTVTDTYTGRFELFAPATVP